MINSSNKAEINDSLIKSKSGLNKIAKSRIWEIDALRGICILLMVFDHFFITLTYIYGVKWFGYSLSGDSGMARLCRFGNWYYMSLPRTVIQPIVAYTFIWLCGLSCGFSRSNLKRGLQLLLISLAVTFLTYVFDKDTGIVTFGILHLLTFCILLWSAIQFITKNDNTAQVIIGLTLMLFIGISYQALINNPAFDQNLADKIFILTDTQSSIAKSPGDFFAVIPWSGLFFLGAGLTSVIYPNKKSLMPKLDRKWNKPLCYCGRNTLFIYCIHQLIFIVIFELISYFSITKGHFVYF